MSKKYPISLVVNTKNEEKDIVECIRSAQELVSEVIVADMHSTDKTIEFAKKEGATVFTVKDVGYVEPARNEAIQKAKNEWVLLLDADERLSPGLVPVLSEIAESDKADVVEIPFKTIILGKWMQHTKWWPV
ncbi:MAG: glycosyltransferase family 2 protein, partial [Patescibacteria group bacterium]